MSETIETAAPARCKDCGVALETPRQVYCAVHREEARKRVYNTSQAKRRGKPLRTEQACKVCGVEIPYSGVGPRPQYCAVHKAEMVAKQSHNAAVRTSERRRSTREARHCAECGAVLTPQQKKWCETHYLAHVGVAQVRALRNYRARSASKARAS